MNNVVMGKGHLAGKGIYADKNFRKGEVVVQYHLKALSQEEFDKLSIDEKMFTHMHHGQIYLYSEPERYVNHSETPNTYQDLEKHQDIALKDIQKGEAITTNAKKDDV